MSTDIKVPALPESVADATVTTWHKKVGDSVEQDQPLVDIETDKVVLEVVAPVGGVLSNIAFDEGETVTADQVLGVIADSLSQAPSQSKTTAPEQKEQPVATPEKQSAPVATKEVASKPEKSQPAPAAQLPQLDKSEIESQGVSPSQRKQALESGQPLTAATQPKAVAAAPVASEPKASSEVISNSPTKTIGRVEKRQKMTRLRQKIAQRLLDAQSQAAMLTTFNEICMDNVMALRSRYKEEFEKKHNIKLGFMSLFTKAVCHALEQFPEVNASIDGQDIVYHEYSDISIAVSSPRGLVVPVVRNAHQKSLAQIETDIMDLSLKARDGQLSIDEMTGGTFTITNGGVFGSLMSTPILNPPQSAILGMHKIEKRPIVVDNQVKISQMMYVALSYDHRIIDGRDSVQFLVAVKKAIEDPERLLLDI